MAQRIYEDWAEIFLRAGYNPIVVAKTKKGAIHDDWNQHVPQLPPIEYVQDLVRRCGDCSIGLATGTYLSTGNLFAAVDIDTPGFVPFVQKVIGSYICGKIGANGLTSLCQGELGLKSVKIKAKGRLKHGVELMLDTGMIVIPPSPHPDGFTYKWDERSLLEITHDQLPVITALKYAVIKSVIKNENSWLIVEGGAGVQGHELMLSLTASGVANLVEDLEWLADCLNALFHPDYTGDTKDETLKMLQSAKEKGLGANGITKNDKTGFVRGIIQNVELFHDTTGRPYTTIKRGQGYSTYSLDSVAAKRWISHQFHIGNPGKPLTSHGISEIINTLSAIACFEGEQKEVYVRVAPSEDGIVIDLGNKQGEVVVVTADGWSVESNSPVKFERPVGMAELPVPTQGGDVTLFKQIFGLNDQNWVLVLCFLICCFHPTGPYFMLLIDAEQGGGKSLLTWAIKQIIDPTKVAKSRLPKDITDLMIMAKENWLLGFDNVSWMSNEISDCFCVLLTGGGQIVRKLYTNDEAHLFNYCRPAIANGITGLNLRPDLLSRTIPLHLDCPAKGNRKTEKELRKAMAEASSAILGGLLDIIVVALQGYDDVIITGGDDMRMADCAQWLMAAEPATGLPEGTLVDSIITNQDSMVEEDVETDPLAQKLLQLVRKGEFSGSIQKLFDTLQLGEEYVSKELPKNASQLSKALRRKKPNYERVGLMVDFPGRLKHGQEIRIWLEAGGGTIVNPKPEY